MTFQGDKSSKKKTTKNAEEINNNEAVAASNILTEEMLQKAIQAATAEKDRQIQMLMAKMQDMVNTKATQSRSRKDKAAARKATKSTVAAAKKKTVVKATNVTVVKAPKVMAKPPPTKQKAVASNKAGGGRVLPTKAKASKQDDKQKGEPSKVHLQEQLRQSLGVEEHEDEPMLPPDEDMLLGQPSPILADSPKESELETLKPAEQMKKVEDLDRTSPETIASLKKLGDEKKKLRKLANCSWNDMDELDRKLGKLPPGHVDVLLGLVKDFPVVQLDGTKTTKCGKFALYRKKLYKSPPEDDDSVVLETTDTSNNVGVSQQIS